MLLVIGLVALSMSVPLLTISVYFITQKTLYIGWTLFPLLGMLMLGIVLLVVGIVCLGLVMFKSISSSRDLRA